MKKSDRAKFAEIILGFAELRGKTLSAPAIELYWRAMQDWDLADFQAAAEHLLKTSEFMPTPKHFEDLRKAGRDTPAEAWLKARRFVRWGVSGHTLDPACPPVLARCIAAVGGPNAVAMCDEDKLHFLERRFCDHFETMRESEDVRDSLPQIAQDPDRSRLAGSGLKRIGAP